MSACRKGFSDRRLAPPAMTRTAGRVCPLAYRYGAAALARAPERVVDTLYVVGGLYGNLPALARVSALFAAEGGSAALCFNGDFNWFDVDDASFVAINEGVLANEAIIGNVEAELVAPQAGAGCGCGYPESVDDAVVERSNRIHARLQATATRHPAIIGRLAKLPMFARYRVGEVTVGVVHGDADSLAGWRFAAAALDDVGNRQWIDEVFAAAAVDIFASTHTCLPALRSFGEGHRPRVVINNGAAGMPNFAGQPDGLLTRIALSPSPHPMLYGLRAAGLHVDALPIVFDAGRWQEQFLANWPPGSAAWLSYYERIRNGPPYSRQQAMPPASEPLA
ncbi:MAG: hypothetical protein FAZ92_00512 [Accumulibacter sp.]|nr:MAG: hypothetical protein FAZ92_00512 [Accumulibacter sp.]